MSQSESAAARLDPNMAVRDADGATCWYDLAALDIEGMGWRETAGPYERLPARAAGVVPGPVWELARHSAGIAARFVTDATDISARWTLKDPNLAMDHMPATGVSGLDLYVRTGSGWRWLGVGRPKESPTNQRPLAEGLAPGRREYLLYLPLYNGVSEVSLGLPVGAVLERAPARAPGAAKPVVFYGTSIVQGGCASRPGMAYPAILGRWLDVPAVNLGFSGNGRMEPEVVGLIAELDAAAFVIDCLPNLEAPQVAERARPLVERLRAARAAAPIVLVENVVYQNAHLVAARRERCESSNRALRAAYQELRAAGVRGLGYVPAEALLGSDGEATVDGTHATDVGFLRIAAAIRPTLERALRS
jgi:hypothetical protein